MYINVAIKAGIVIRTFFCLFIHYLLYFFSMSMIVYQLTSFSGEVASQFNDVLRPNAPHLVCQLKLLPND